jgi:hypothetical protein
MSLHISRGSLPLVSIALLGYAATADSPWQLPVAVAMALMSWSIVTTFVKRPMPLPMPIAVQHE